MNGRGALLALTLALAALPARADDAAPAKAVAKDAKAAAPAAPAAPPAKADIANVERMFLERAAISAADGKCSLFSDGERMALRSGLYQAEGELLRAGRAPSTIADLSGQVRAHARSLGCDHPSVLQVAGTIRSSYRQFQKTTWLEYPGKYSAWGVSRSEHDAWAVSQADKASGAVFGLRRPDKEKPEAMQLAIAIPADGRAPASVQMSTRDPVKAGDPWLGTLSGASGALAAAPRGISGVMWAGKVSEEEDSTGNEFHVFYFSPAAIARLEALDPRETVQIELTPPQREKDAKPARILFEVGDIRAAHAFARIPKPTYAAPPAAAGGKAAAH